MINVGIIGATGYAGYETLKLLLAHPNFKVTCVVSRTFAGKKISDVYTNLERVCDLVCEPLDYNVIIDKADCFVCALPHGASQDTVSNLVSAGKKVVDLSADYRYTNKDTYESIYNLDHKYPKLLKDAVYGIPELYRENIKGSYLVANPGCYPTCSILGLAPLLANNLIDTKSIIIDAVSGISGAGRKEHLFLSLCEASENYVAYQIAKHRHTTEIEENLSLLANKDIKITFTPHRAPMKRGMMATIYASLSSDIDSIMDIYKEYYKDEFFIRVKDTTSPNTKSVVGSNFVDISPFIDKRNNRVIITSSIDNIGKGASSQAIQNLNIMYELDEKTGIAHPGNYL